MKYLINNYIGYTQNNENKINFNIYVTKKLTCLRNYMKKYIEIKLRRINSVEMYTLLKISN